MTAWEAKLLAEARDATYLVPPYSRTEWAWAARGEVRDGYRTRDEAILEALEYIQSVDGRPEWAS